MVSIYSSSAPAVVRAIRLPVHDAPTQPNNQPELTLECRTISPTVIFQW